MLVLPKAGIFLRYAYAVESASYGMVFQTKFHDDSSRYSSYIMIITSTISEDAGLVLLMGGIYEVFR
jgi:hypothetical protein